MLDGISQAEGIVKLPVGEQPVYRTRFLGHKFVSCGGPE